MHQFRKKYIGEKDFYLYALSLALPMIIQSLITNFVSMLDNVMVGQVGTLQMSGVSIVNQFIFVFNITIFGGVSGASIFGTQFYGKKDHEGQKYTFRYRLLMMAILILIGMLVLSLAGDGLIRLFLSEDDAPEMIAQTLAYGKEYLSIIIWSLIPFGIGQAYCSVVRECGETRIPMYGSMAAIGVNLFLDYALIFGKFGCPQLGVAGAAIATVIAKCIEASVVILWAHSHPERNPYIVGAYRDFFHIPGELIRRIVLKSCPLVINEFLWALGMSVVAQCYSVKGLDVVAARNIASTLTNLFSVVYVQFGGAIGIIIGMELGAGRFEQARDRQRQLSVFAVLITFAVVLCMIPVGICFPQVYQTEAGIKELATYFIIVMALVMPVQSYTNASYFTLRSGGRIAITFLFDSGFTWLIFIPLAYILTHRTGLDIRIILPVVTFSEAIKMVIGHLMVRSDIWVQNIVNDSE